jgi:prolyl oligopeptidase
MRTAAWLLVALGTNAFAATAPDTRVQPVTDTYFGRSVDDPYRWLEDLHAADVRDWFTAQNAYARTILDALPDHAALRDRIAALVDTDARVRNAQWGGEQLFYEKRAPREDRFQLFVRTGVDGAERLLVDPARFDAEGQPAAINFYIPSPTGKRVAFGVSLGGNEDATLHVIDVASGREIGTAVPRMDIGDPVGWRIDGRALYYTQLNAPVPGQDAVEKYRSARVYARDFGSAADRPVFGRGLDEAITLDPDDVVRVRSFLSSYAIASVQHGNDAELTLYAAPLAQLGLPRVPWRRITRFEDGVTGFDVRGEWIYLQTNAGVPRYRVVRWPLAGGEPLSLAHAEVLVPESTRVITGLSVARDALYVQSMDGGYDRLQRLEFNVKVRKPARKGTAVAALPKTAGIARATEVALPFEGTIEERVVDPMRAGALVRLAGWTAAPACPCRSCIRATRAATARHRCCSTPTARTASASSRSSGRRCWRGWSAAASTPWRTSAAAANSARPGTTRGAWRTSPTPGSTSSLRARRSCASGGRARHTSESSAAAPAASRSAARS